jgi:hypothetical protein
VATRLVDFAAAVAGVLLALVLMAFAAASTPIGISSPGLPSSIAYSLWMHPAVPTSSGSETWYNFSLTVNQTIPLSDLSFIFYKVNMAAYPPPTFNFSVVKSSMAFAEYDFTTQVWTSGGSGHLVSGDGFEVEVTDQNLAGDTLRAIGQGTFSSYCSAQFL